VKKMLFLTGSRGRVKLELGLFVVALFLALVGVMVSGCDGGSAGPGDSGDAVVADVARPVSCSVPSPTGDQPSGYGTARDLPASNHVLVSNDVRSACEAWKAAYPASYASRPAGPDPKIAAGVDCSDVSHDFQGSSGVPWSVVAADPSGAPCSATADSGSCAAAGMAEMPRYQSSDPQERLYVRSWALCTPSRVFAGWMYTAS